ncbi:ABC transporter permease [Arthrobacter sp. B2a2-09]|uniref:ABC transporter permease n=1 Tax=Arthrobacter sp. B2a2-09 TaxID=2952822 RepID=UPI0022CD53AC|nr:ABC transporter permease subunit [Arthrobacter sp. B2a2-09]MCZ9884926.1 ABC transporter permease subunit [Arthrobacter sp. B2a2-09]
MSALKSFFGRWWAVLAVVLLWQAIVTVFGINQFLIPSPWEIITGIAGDPTQFLLPLALTLETAAIGFVLGVTTGYLMASLSWLWPVFGAALTPFALVVRAVPFVALIPVLTKAFGYSETTSWIICAMVCFFPTFVLVGTGLHDVPANGNDLFSVAGASRFDRYRRLAAPASLLALATSIRVSSASAFAAALISQFLMGVPGLAYVLANALDRLNMTLLWGAAACAIVVGFLAYLTANRFEAYVLKRWR